MLATTLRALEIALCAFYPSMPRFALLRSALSWVRRFSFYPDGRSDKRHSCAKALGCMCTPMHSEVALCLPTPPHDVWPCRGCLTTPKAESRAPCICIAAKDTCRKLYAALSAGQSACAGQLNTEHPPQRHSRGQCTAQEEPGRAAFATGMAQLAHAQGI